MANARPILLRLTTGDETTTRSAPWPGAPKPLGDKADALVRIGVLVALGASCATYVHATRLALVSGASVEEIVETLVAISTIVGLARVVAAVRGIGLGVGYDIDAALQT